jgi:hypothetical protein
MDNFYSNISTIAIRNGLIYRPIPQLRLVAGYAYFRIASLRGILPTPHEHRGWQMVQWTQNNLKTRYILGIRAEQRFREQPLQGSHSGDYVFNHRFRYNINVNIKLNKIKSWVIGNEFMHNVGKEIIYNKFDQNRTWTGIQHQISPKLQIQILYMLLYQHLPRPQERLLSHNIRITIFKSE